MSTTAVCPGDRLALQGEYIAGAGTHTRNGAIYASLLGYRATRPATTSDQASPSAQAGTLVLEVQPSGRQSHVPKPGDLVTVRVARVQPTSANCVIMCVGPHALSADFRGVIRQQDVRATEIDRVVMYDSFRPGDLVRAEVLSLGDARSFYLSTAKDHLGVVYATSVSGHEMTVTDWTTMTCSKTLAVEKRKVANINASS